MQNIPREKRRNISSLCSRMCDEYDSQNLDKFLLDNSFLVPNAILGLKTLITMNGSENVFIVSRASNVERLVNRRLFVIHNFYEMTGLLPMNIFFVDLCAEKAEVCRRLSVQGHIDDRGEVHYNLRGVVPNLVWFSPSKGDVSRWTQELSPHVIRVSGWRDLISML